MDPLIKLLGSWAGELNAGSVVLRILLSVFLSAVIGCERANKRHSAGLRTFIIICLASACAMLLDEFLMSSGKTGFPFVSAAAVIAVAIISTYSILYSARSQIKGLTTAAGLWACGILGLTAGAGYYTVSLCMFVALISCLSALPTLEIYLKNRSNHF